MERRVKTRADRRGDKGSKDDVMGKRREVLHTQYAISGNKSNMQYRC